MRAIGRFVLGALAIGACSCHAVAAPAVTVQDIVNSYAQRESATNAVFVAWHGEYQLHVPADVVKQIEGIADYTTADVWAACKGDHRYYFQEHTAQFGTKELLYVVGMSYEGKTTRLLMDAKRARIFPGDQTAQFTPDDQFMTFHGFPKASMKLRKSAVEWFRAAPVSSFDKTYTIDDELRAAEDGASCVVVGSKTDRVWLDPSRGFLTRQRDFLRSSDGSLALRVRLNDPFEVAPGVWFAMSLSSDYFAEPARFAALSGKSYLTYAIEVSEISLNVLDDTFELDFPAGTHISDMTRVPISGRGYPVVAYKMPSDAEDLESIVAHSTAVTVASLDAEWWRKLWNVALFMTLVVAILSAAVAIWRWRSVRVF